MAKELSNAEKGRDASGEVIDPEGTYAALYMIRKGVWHQHAICSGHSALEMINNSTEPSRLRFYAI